MPSFCFRLQSTCCLVVFSSWLAYADRTPPCSCRVHDRVHGRSVYTACTRPGTRWSTRLSTPPVHCRVHDPPVHGSYGGVHGRVYCPYMAVNTAYTRPCTRIHGPYTKPIEFATFWRTLVITYLNKAKSHIACHPKFIKYGVNGVWDKDSLFTDGPYKCFTDVSQTITFLDRRFPDKLY